MPDVDWERFSNELLFEELLVNEVFDTQNYIKLLEVAVNWRNHPERELAVKQQVGEEVFLIVQNGWIEWYMDAAARPSNIIYPKDVEEQHKTDNELELKYWSDKLQVNLMRLKEIQESRRNA